MAAYFLKFTKIEAPIGSTATETPSARILDRRPSGLRRTIELESSVSENRIHAWLTVHGLED